MTFGIKLVGYMPGEKSKIDFSEWEWGDFDGVLKPIADRVAGVLYDELVDSINEHHSAPYLNFDYEDCDGQLTLVISVLDDPFLLVPLQAVELDTEFWPKAIDRKLQAIEMLKGWISTIEKSIAEDREEQP